MKKKERNKVENWDIKLYGFYETGKSFFTGWHCCCTLLKYLYSMSYHTGNNNSYSTRISKHRLD